MKLKNKLLALASSLLIATSASAATYKITAPHTTSTDGYNHQSLLLFKNLVENKSNGQIQVDIYPGGQLCGTARECLAGVQTGMFDYFQTTVPEMANYWQPMSAMDLPYMLEDDKIAECVYSNETFIDDIRNEFIKHSRNTRLMMISNSGGWRNFATNKKQVKTPEDLKGLKLRTVPAPIQQELVREMAAAPTPVAWPEVYTALSTGVVDGTKNGIVDIIMGRFHESLKHITLDGHAYMGGVWVMNDRKFSSMPVELREIVLDGIDAQNQFLRAYPKWKEASAYDEFRKAGGKVYNPNKQEKEAFRKAAQPVIDNYLKETDEEGKRWYARFQSEIATCKAENQKRRSLAL